MRCDSGTMRTAGAAIAAGVVLTLLAGLAAAGAPASQAATTPAPAPAAAADPNAPVPPVTDEQIREAIRKGASYLIGRRDPNGSWAPKWGAWQVGPTALAARALLETRQVDYRDPNMQRTLAWLASRQTKEREIKAWDTSGVGVRTYEVSLRARVWLAAIEAGGTEYRKNLDKDMKQLLLSTQDGSYGYQSLGDGRSHGDNSNSAYGAAGVLASAQGGVEVPKAYWRLVLQRWDWAQCKDGGFGYQRVSTQSTSSMTAEGLATIWHMMDQLTDEALTDAKSESWDASLWKPVNRNLQWLDEHVPRIFSRPPGELSYGSFTYTLQAYQQAGEATGRWTFGGVDWYREGAKVLLSRQKEDGSWRGAYGETVLTSYAVLFLGRGYEQRRRPCIVHMQYDGDWANRPFAMKAFTDWAGRTKGASPLAWRVAGFSELPEPSERSPVVLITGAKHAAFTKEQLERLKRYVDRGGTLVSVAERSRSDPNNQFGPTMRDTYKKLFGEKALRELPRDHGVYKSGFTLSKELALQGVTEGERLLAVHVEEDWTRAWQLRQTKTQSMAFEAMYNVCEYARRSAGRSGR